MPRAARHWRLDVLNQADMHRKVMILADARQEDRNNVDLLLMGKDYTGSYRTKLVRMTPEEANTLARNLKKAAKAAKPKID